MLFFINGLFVSNESMVNEVLENKDLIVEKLVEHGLTNEEIESKIKDKQEEYGGLLTDAGAAYAIAKELNVEVGLGEPVHEPIKIKDIKADLEGVDIEGEVTQVFPVKNWKNEKRSGKVGSVIVKDDTGEIRLTLWNADCDLIENGEIQRGAKIKVENSSSNERNGLVQLSMGYRGEINILEKGIPKLTKLSEIEEGMNDVNFAARVERIYPLTEFQKKDGVGKVMSMVVSDGTERRLALWDDNTKWEGKVHEGDTVLIEGAYVRMNRGKAELNLGWRGRLIPNPVGIEVMQTRSRKELINVKDGEQTEIRATVVKVYSPNLYDVCTKCGKKHDGECCGEPKTTMVVNAELDDGTGVVRGVFFRDQAEKLLGISAEEYSKDHSCFDEMKPLGQELLFTGTTRHNEMFKRNEFIVRGFHEVNVEQEIQVLKGD